MRRGVAGEERVKGRLRGHHPRLDAEVDAFEASAVEVAGGIADDHESVAVHARHREVAAFGDGLRAGRDHLAARKNLADGRMHFEALELLVRVERRITVVESDDKADVDDAITHPV